MKFKIKCSQDSPGNLGEWEEEYNINTDNPQKWAEDIISEFNSGLREGESSRKLINVTVLDEVNNVPVTVEHDWEKQNMYTEKYHGSLIDRHKCKKCGITGKRYGLSPNIRRDGPYLGKVYDKCDTAQARLEKLRLKKERRMENEQTSSN